MKALAKLMCKKLAPPPPLTSSRVNLLTSGDYCINANTDIHMFYLIQEITKLHIPKYNRLYAFQVSKDSIYIKIKIAEYVIQEIV